MVDPRFMREVHKRAKRTVDDWFDKMDQRPGYRSFVGGLSYGLLWLALAWVVRKFFPCGLGAYSNTRLWILATGVGVGTAVMALAGWKIFGSRAHGLRTALGYVVIGICFVATGWIIGWTPSGPVFFYGFFYGLILSAFLDLSVISPLPKLSRRAQIISTTIFFAALGGAYAMFALMGSSPALGGCA